MSHEETKRCPYCDEDIRVNARVCKHCGRDLDSEAQTTPGGDQPAWWTLTGPLREKTEVREYRIEKILGEGGMGEVYLASHTMTGQKVAMKVISPELVRDEGTTRRFLEEGRVMAALKHPNIVRLLNFFEEGGRFFLVMDFIDGPTLESMLKERQLPVEEAIRIMTGVLTALHHAHSQARMVVHRDIKPANIMLGKGGSVVVTDFGIAKAAGREKLTRTRGIVGTFEYMSPEQVQGEDVTPASDIYACGITLYHMVTGVVPYPQKSDGGFECMQAHVSTPLPSIRQFREATPDWLERVITKSLAKDPADRFSSAKAMIEALFQKQAPKVARAEPVPVRPRPRPVPAVEPDDIEEGGLRPARGKFLLIGIAATVALVVVLAFSFGSGNKGGKKKEAQKKTERVKRKPVREKMSAEQEKREAEAARKEEALKARIKEQARLAAERERERLSKEQAKAEAEAEAATVAEEEEEEEEEPARAPRTPEGLHERRTRIQQIYKLGRSGAPEDLKRLEEIVKGDAQSYEKATAIRAMGTERRNSLVPSLKELADSNDLAVQSEAVILLYQWGEKSFAKPILLTLLDKGVALRRAFFLGLQDGEYVYEPGAAGFFEKALDANQVHVQLDAALGLLHMGRKRKALSAFEAALNDMDKEYVRLTAISYLASARDIPEARHLIQKAADNDPSPKVANRARQILGVK